MWSKKNYSVGFYEVIRIKREDINLHFCLKIAVLVLLLAVNLYLLGTVIQKIDLIGGPDFFYYLLNARDVALGGPTAGEIYRYFYFPGVYWFWTWAIQLFGTNMYMIQVFYAGLLLASVALTFLTIQFLFRNTVLSFVAVPLHLLMLEPMQGFQGCTEPLIIFAVQIGFLLFVYLRRAQWLIASALALSFFLGIAWFTKQQGIFFVAPAIALATDKKIKLFTPDWRILLTPILALLFVVLFFYLDGIGLKGLVYGTSRIAGYESQDLLFENLARLYETIRFSVHLFLIVGFVFLLTVAFAAKRFFNEAQAYYLRDMIFLIGAGVLSLYQFNVRDYLHYGYFLIPCMIYSMAYMVYFIHGFLDKVSVSRSMRWGIGVFAFFVYYKSSISSIKTAFEQTRPSRPEGILEERFYRDTSYALDKGFMEPICPALTDTSVLLIPARNSIFHWVCQTGTSDLFLSYGWGFEDMAYYRPLIENPKTKNLFLFSSQFGAYEKSFFENPDFKNIEEIIKKAGYKEHAVFTAGVLFIRDKKF